MFACFREAKNKDADGLQVLKLTNLKRLSAVFHQMMPAVNRAVTELREETKWGPGATIKGMAVLTSENNDQKLIVSVMT